MKDSAIRIFADEPDCCSDTPRTEHDWEFSACSGAKEELPKDAPEPLGRTVVTATYVDANLHHCMMTGKLALGVPHLFNKTSTDWHAKKQGAAETATWFCCCEDSSRASHR
jgi:hypothetical protein